MEFGLRHQETPSRVTFLEVEVSKWRATAPTVWRVDHPKVASATIAFAEIVRSNHQLSSKVGSVLANLLCTRLDDDELFKCCKDLQEEKKDLAGRVEDIATEKDELAKKVADLKAQLKESESRLEEFALRTAREREDGKELEEKLLIYMKKAIEQHEKGFNKAVRHTEFFVKDLDLGLFDPFKDVKDNVLLDKEEIVMKEEAFGEEQGAEE